MDVTPICIFILIDKLVTIFLNQTCCLQTTHISLIDKFITIISCNENDSHLQLVTILIKI